MIFSSQNKGHRTAVALNLQPRKGPFGGGNQWAAQISAYLRSTGYAVSHEIRDRTACVLGTHTGPSPSGLAFSYADVLKAKELNPRLRCIQRINDNDIRKGTSVMDPHLAECNRAADHTVFVSRWLRDYHAERWFDVSRPHSVIWNGADPAVFHPFGGSAWKPGETLRVCTHHWSDNPAKGFDVYRELDELIASGRLKGIELRVIGRWPADLHWKAAKTFSPCSGGKLAGLLRGCHACITASRHEPGAMHPVEALACGLPLLYTSDTGGTVELGQKFGVQIGRDGLEEGLERLKEEYSALREHIFREAPTGDLMCLSYRQLVQRVICENS